MPNYLGIILAIVALFSWGFGDFFAQKISRKIGVWKSLFCMGLVGSVLLFSFVRNDLIYLSPSSDWSFLILLGVIFVFATTFDSKALKEGKLSIIEPLIGIELPITVGLSIVLGGESLSFTQSLSVLVVFIGIVLTMTTHLHHLKYHRRIFEKGVILAGVGAITMALTNFLIGISSQSISAIVTVWFADTLLLVVCGLYLIYRKELTGLWFDFKKEPGLLIMRSLSDNVGWISFALATTLIPISIATTISESYIILGVILGIFVNHERLRRNQFIGIVLVVGGILTLSALSVN